MKDNMYTIYIYGLTWFRLGLFFRKLKNPYTIGSMTELVQAKINNPLFTLGSKSSNDFGSTPLHPIGESLEVPNENVTKIESDLISVEFHHSKY